MTKSDKLIVKMFYKDIIKEKDSEIKGQEDLIEQLHDHIAKLNAALEEIQSQIPVTNNEIAGFHQAGVVQDDEYDDEPDNRTTVMGFKTNIQ